MKCDDCIYKRDCSILKSLENSKPYQPYYRPYGMDEDQYQYEIEIAKLKLHNWEQEFENCNTYKKEN